MSQDPPLSGRATELRFEERPGYLYAFVAGEEDSLSVSLDYW